MSGVNQLMTRGIGEGSSPEEGIGGGGDSKSSHLWGGFWWRGGQTVMPSREEGSGVLHLGWSFMDGGEVERSTSTTLSHREEITGEGGGEWGGMGPARRALRRKKGGQSDRQLCGGGHDRGRGPGRW
jgi:hypothetical protein